MSKNSDLQPTYFCLIGAMKSGTSSLHEYLGLHPDISVSKLKETNYFSRSERYAKGESWYLKQLGGKRGELCIGEASTAYSKRDVFPGVPQRMRNFRPDAKLIYLLRDPVKRVLSHYLHNVAYGREERRLGEAVGDPSTSNYVRASCYFYQLSAFREYFPDEQLLVLSMEEMVATPQRTVRQALEFLGVDPEFEHADIGAIHNASKGKGEPNRLGRAVQRLPGGRDLRYALPSLFEQKLERPKLASRVENRMREHLADDVQRLRAWSGLRFEDWSL